MSTPIVRKTVAPDKAFTECRGPKARPHLRFACAKLEGTYAITRGARMEAYKQEFIKFMVESDVLKFGSFTLKSGRQSPFFMNAGAYVTGYQLKKLGEYYAQAIHDNFGDDFDVLFGPAYKGIPLAVVTAIAYHELYGKEVKYCCDRKEAKDHGADKGNLLGYEPAASSSSPLSRVPALSPAALCVPSLSLLASRTSCPSPSVPTTASTSSRLPSRASRSSPALRTSRLAVA